MGAGPGVADSTGKSETVRKPGVVRALQAERDAFRLSLPDM
jgi:hypothetical protein